MYVVAFLSLLAKIFIPFKVGRNLFKSPCPHSSLKRSQLSIGELHAGMDQGDQVRRVHPTLFPRTRFQAELARILSEQDNLFEA